MKKEESLIEIKESKFKSFLDSVKSFFGKLFNKDKKVQNTVELSKETEVKNEDHIQKNNNEELSISTLEDMDLLAKVVKGEIKSKELEPEVQERLIKLCRKRRMEVREKIKQADEKIEKINSLLLEIEEIKKMEV